jgi:hypothetical protein
MREAAYHAARKACQHSIDAKTELTPADAAALSVDYDALVSLRRQMFARVIKQQNYVYEARLDSYRYVLDVWIDDVFQHRLQSPISKGIHDPTATNALLCELLVATASSGTMAQASGPSARASSTLRTCLQG